MPLIHSTSPISAYQPPTKAPHRRYEFDQPADPTVIDSTSWISGYPLARTPRFQGSRVDQRAPARSATDSGRRIITTPTTSYHQRPSDASGHDHAESGQTTSCRASTALTRPSVGRRGRASAGRSAHRLKPQRGYVCRQRCHKIDHAVPVLIVPARRTLVDGSGRKSMRHLLRRQVGVLRPDQRRRPSHNRRRTRSARALRVLSAVAGAVDIDRWCDHVDLRAGHRNGGMLSVAINATNSNYAFLGRWITHARIGGLISCSSYDYNVGVLGGS